jgi:hypothetical protein
MPRRFTGPHSARTVIRPPLVLSDWQEQHLRRTAETLPLEYRGKFHAVVRSKLVGSVGDGEVYAMAAKVHRAILSGAKLVSKKA